MAHWLRPYLAGCLVLLGTALVWLCLATPGTVDVAHWLTWMTNTRQLGPAPATRLTKPTTRR
jgi:hypothetical protein